MPIRVQAETGCYNPGVPMLNSNTNESNTFAKSVLRYPTAFSGLNFYLYNYTQAQFESFFMPTDLDTCVTQGQDYFYQIIDTTATYVESTLSLPLFPAIGPATRVATPICGLPQDIPENLIATQCRSTPGPIPSVGGSSTNTQTGETTNTTVTGGSGGANVYGSTAHGSYVRSSIITCSTESINSETGTVGGTNNPEFFVADTNSKFIFIQYDGGSRKIQSGETLSFTVSEVTRVSTTGSWSGYAWTPVFNRTYANVTYTFNVESVKNFTAGSGEFAHVKVGTTAARFRSELQIKGGNNLSFKVKAGRNVQTRAAIYGRWEFDQKEVYWLKEFTSPIKNKNDVKIISSTLELTDGTNIDSDTRKEINDATKRRNVIVSGSTSSQNSLEAISSISQAKNLPDSTVKAVNDAVKNSDLTKKSSNSFDIDVNRDVNAAIESSLNVNTITTRVDHYVKDVEKSSTKKLIHTNPVSGKSPNSIDSKKSLGLIGIEVDVTKPNISIAEQSNFESKSTINRSDFEQISRANTNTAKVTAQILTGVHDSANQSISDINSQNKNNPYNNSPGPSNKAVKEYGPVNSFDKLPKSTETEKIQPYRYDADKRMNKSFSFSLQINMFATPCGPCYTVSTSTTGGSGGDTSSSLTCSLKSGTPSGYTLPFQKVFINNLTPEAQRWARITRNYQDDYTL